MGWLTADRDAKQKGWRDWLGGPKDNPFLKLKFGPRRSPWEPKDEGGGDSTPPNYSIDPNGMLHLNPFDPGTSNTKVQPIELSLNIDGQSFAKTIGQLLMLDSTFSNVAPAPNGRKLWTDAGTHNFNTG
jgi:hypothetical protein